jgi:hypothetical protein
MKKSKVNQRALEKQFLKGEREEEKHEVLEKKYIKSLKKPKKNK